MKRNVQKDMLEENPKELIQDHRGYYLMVNAIAKRVRQLQLGEKAQATLADGTRDGVRIATLEFVEDKLDIIPKVPNNRLVDVISREDEE
jgi:DNA-directed RNA polymerase subunit K/omega